jgi:hypothetical protein
MTQPFLIEPRAFYDEASLRNATGITASALAGARKAGLLRYTRRSGRTLYLGQWILEWLTPEVTTAAKETLQQEDRGRKAVAAC